MPAHSAKHITSSAVWFQRTQTGGTSATDFLIGSRSDDSFFGDTGNDVIVGLKGYDTAVFSGSVLDYSFENGPGDKITVSGPDGEDLLIGIEELKFDDYAYYADGRNNDPFAVGESFSLLENSNLHLTSLLDNDVDFDGDDLHISAVSQGSLGGTVTLLADGTVQYDTGSAFDWLAAGETATEIFTYEVSDGRGGNVTSTVEMTVEGVNDAVVLAASTLSGSVKELASTAAGADTDLHSSSGVLAFSDADLSDMHTAVFEPLGQEYLGTFSIGTPTTTNNTTDGQVAWTFEVDDADLDFLLEGETREQSYKIYVDDGNGSVLEQTVVVKITGTNEAPELTGVVLVNNLLIYGEDISFHSAGFFTDPDSNDLAYSAEGLPAGLILDPETGVMSGTLSPEATFGQVAVTFTATDAHGASISRQLLFTAPDPAPVANDDHFAITSGLTVTGDLGANDPEPVYPFSLQPIYEHIYALTEGVVSAGPSAGNASVVINPDGTFTYTADPRVFGSDQFAYTVTDAFGNTSTAVVTIDIPKTGAIAEDGTLGTLSFDKVNIVRSLYGTPTGLDSVEIRIPLSEIASFVGGDPEDPLYKLQVGAVFDPDSGQIVVGVQDPENTTWIDGDQLVLRIPASMLDDQGGLNELSFVYGYPYQTEVHSTVDLRPESEGYPGITLVVDGYDTAAIDFVAGFSFVDDRPAGGDGGGVDVGGIEGSGPLDGYNGTNGTLALNIQNGQDVTIYDGANYVAYAFANFGQLLIYHFEDIAYSFENGFDIYTVTHGTNGADNPVVISKTVGGGNAPLVIFGADGLDAGDGGDGGDGTTGGDGYIEPITPLAAFTVDGPNGANGGDGGDGASTSYQIIGSSYGDVIVGGNGGDAGQDGADGQDGESGADVENTYSGGISGGEVAYGGEGGHGGAGGSGGSTLYHIMAGAGDDEIWGGNAGQSADDAIAIYRIEAGDGNDMIHAGDDLSGARQNSTGYGYELLGEGGDDTFLFNDVNIRGGVAEKVTNYSSTDGLSFAHFSTGILLDGGSGFDRLVIETEHEAATNFTVIGDHFLGFESFGRSLDMKDMEYLETDNYADVYFGLSADYINSITSETEGLHTLFINAGASTDIALNSSLASWERTDDATTLDGVSYDLLYNDATQTQLYVTDADGLIWV